jgi:hypothetical protein
MDHYPVDNITKKTNCELHVPMKNISMKVAEAKRNRLSPTERIVGIQEEIAGFLLDHVINPKGEFHVSFD